MRIFISRELKVVWSKIRLKLARLSKKKKKKNKEGIIFSIWWTIPFLSSLASKILREPGRSVEIGSRQVAR